MMTNAYSGGFYAAAVSANTKVFAGDIDKYKYLQMHYLTLLRYRFFAHAFALTDDTMYMLLGKGGKAYASGVAESIRDPYADTASEDQKSIRKMMEDIFYRKYMPYYQSLYRNDQRDMTVQIMVEGPCPDNILVHAASLLHVLPVREGLADTAESWYWTSYPAYRGEQKWDFQETGKVLSLIDVQPDLAGKIFLQQVRRMERDAVKCRKTGKTARTKKPRSAAVLEDIRWLLERRLV